MSVTFKNRYSVSISWLDDSLKGLCIQTDYLLIELKAMRLTKFTSGPVPLYSLVVFFLHLIKRLLLHYQSPSRVNARSLFSHCSCGSN